MSDRFDQAEALVRNARTKLVAVEDSYRVSLHDKAVSIDLYVGIKEIIDNLRSALDYIAYDIAETHGNMTASSKVYFPIARRGSKANDFKSLVGKNIPGLASNRPDLVDVIESFQEFKSSKNAWLPDLATLSIENKHKNLSPQTRKEAKQLRIQSGGVSMQMGEGCSISMGPGTSITMGGMTIPGGQVLQPGSLVHHIGPGTVENIVWVSFEFSEIRQPVLPFLGGAVEGVARIIKTIRSKLQS